MEQQAECSVLTKSLEQNLMYYNFL